MLASTPANILNHKTSKNGIPSDSAKYGNALAVAVAAHHASAQVAILLRTRSRRRKLNG